MQHSAKVYNQSRIFIITVISIPNAPNVSLSSRGVDTGQSARLYERGQSDTGHTCSVLTLTVGILFKKFNGSFVFANNSWNCLNLNARSKLYSVQLKYIIRQN